MKIERKQSGFTIIELLVVIGIIALMIAIALPAINAMQKSFDSTGTTSMIGAALATARTLAISHQQYAGVRFQTSYKPADVLDEEQYMIFIIYGGEKEAEWTCGFKAVEGYKPIKLPENIGVIDKLIINTRAAKCGDLYSEVPLSNFSNTNTKEIFDTTTFSIVFSPAGKLVIHELRCASTGDSDIVFNTKNNVEADSPIGMFVEDNYDSDGLGVEKSRNQFYLYNREELRKITDATQRWNYINSIKSVSVNPYTGGIIDKN